MKPCNVITLVEVRNVLFSFHRTHNFTYFLPLCYTVLHCSFSLWYHNRSFFSLFYVIFFLLIFSHHIFNQLICLLIYNFAYIILSYTPSPHNFQNFFLSHSIPNHISFTFPNRSYLTPNIKSIFHFTWLSNYKLSQMLFLTPYPMIRK